MVDMETRTFQCNRCHRWFESTWRSRSVRCLVDHAPNSCCHYAQREIDPPQATSAANVDTAETPKMADSGLLGDEVATDSGQSETEASA